MTADGALHGLRVLDLADERGVYCAKLLALLGADVVRVEPPDGDRLRRLGPFLGQTADPDQSLFHWYYNLNKRAVRLDLATPVGRERLLNLATEADVLVETFQPGYLAGLGLGYDALSRRNPRLIAAAISGFGQTGPHSAYLAPDLVAWATSGVMNLTGEPGRPPLRAAWNQASHVAALYALIAILAAVAERRSSGLGQAIDISLQEAAAAIAESTPLFYGYLRQNVTRNGSGHPMAAPFRVVESADGYALVPAVTRAQWEALVGWMARDGITDQLADTKYLDLFNRIAEREHIEGLVQQWARRYDSQTIFTVGQSLALATAPINRPADAVANEQLRHRQFFVAVEHSELGRTLDYPGPPFRLSEGSPSACRRAPLRAEVADSADWLPRAGSPTPAAPEAGAAPVGPLQGVKLLDFTWLVAGPFAVRILADLGAEVVKIEPRGVGDPARALSPFKSDYPRTVNASGEYNNLNQNKRSLAIDAKRPEGLALLKRLVAWADVVIDNFSAGALARMGLGYEDVLRQINPRIIAVGMSGFGATGPYKDYVSFHPTLTALCGLSYLTAYADGPPLGYNNSFMDFLGGLHGAAATLVALEQRAKTGRGQFVDLAQFECGAALIGPALLECLATGRDSRPTGNALPERPAAPHNAYPCAGDDRWIAIAVLEDAQWVALRREMGNPAWARDGRFATAAGRAANLAQIDRGLAAWTAQFEPHALMRRLQVAGVPAGVVANGEDLLERDEHLRERGFFRWLDHPEIGPIVVDQSPMRLSRTPAQFRYRTPLLTENNETILREILGLDEEAIVALVLEEVI